MNKKDCNCCCWHCCCENFKNDCGCGHEKESHQCCCEKEKEFPKCNYFQNEKDFHKCGCSHEKYENENYDYGFNNQYKNEGFCGCQKGNYEYEKYDQKNYGWY